MSIWTEISKKSTSWSAISKQTTAFRTLNTFKEIVFDSSYTDNYKYDEGVILDNASNETLNVKSLYFTTITWTTV